MIIVWHSRLSCKCLEKLGSLLQCKNNLFFKMVCQTYLHLVLSNMSWKKISIIDAEIKAISQLM